VTSHISRLAGASLLQTLVCISAAAQGARVGLEMVSRAPNGDVGNQVSDCAVLSADGHFVAFASTATNLVVPPPSDTFDQQVYLRDRSTEQTTLISRDAAGEAGNGKSYCPSISSDGRYVAFASDAQNLLPALTSSEVYVYDTSTGSLRAAVNGFYRTYEDQSPPQAVVSDNGARLVVISPDGIDPKDTDGVDAVYLRDFTAGTTTWITALATHPVPFRGSAPAGISGDGRFLLYESIADGLVTGDSDGIVDVFLLDSSSGVTLRLTTPTVSTKPSCYTEDRNIYIARSGRYAVFSATRCDLVANQDLLDNQGIFAYDIAAGTLVPVSLDAPGTTVGQTTDHGTISDDGSLVTLESTLALTPDDHNIAYDVYVRDRVHGQTYRISAGTTTMGGGGTKPFMDAHGSDVAFTSSATDLLPDSTVIAQIYVATLDRIFASGFE
jgi:Tol biopolymer transport system component